MYGGKFGGSFIPETKKPIDELTKLFAKLRKDKKFLKREIATLKLTWVLLRPLLN